jgi:protein-tyrosine kinase
MTRLSEALKKAAEQTAMQPAAGQDAAEAGPAAPAAWQFSAVETMHVPDEPEPRPEPQPAAPVEHQRSAGRVAAAPAEIPPLRVGDADRDKLIVGGADAAVVEQYRHLAAVLHHAQKASGVRSVMVTSAMPSEGKTLTATNLALTLSESYQRRVLLIDADLRRPRMQEMFVLPATEGLTDSLLTPRTGRLPVHQVTPTLWVLSSGRVLPDPMSMLASPQMKQLLDDARDSFDWVVVDTPPIAVLPDANLLSAMIDTALLVVSAQSTPYSMVQRAVRAIGPNHILGVVLNRADHGGMPVYNYGNSRYQQQGAAEPKRWFRWFRKNGAAASISASASASAPPQGPGHVQ